MSNFKINGNQIFSEVSGDLVAVIENGSVKMQPGKNALTPKVKAFYEEVKGSFVEAAVLPLTMSPFPDAEEEEVNTSALQDECEKSRIVIGDAPPKGGTSAPAAEVKKEHKKVVEQLAIWDIPESELPAFDPALGTSTPEFKRFIAKHKLTPAQIVELVRRLERL
ncbi:MAG: hypothetical protein IKC77_07230 [Lentisphaeria bacterium]|nr:hypothetical protein [Lentisphaeria bacterium]